MEFVDLKAQYRHIGARVDARIRRVLEHQRFILGPEVQELEERLAARVEARRITPTLFDYPGYYGTDSLAIFGRGQQ